jgi:hypothetical protein
MLRSANFGNVGRDNERQTFRSIVGVHIGKALGVIS